MPLSALPMTAIPLPIVRGASSANVGGFLSASLSNSNVWTSVYSGGSAVLSPRSRTKFSGTVGTSPLVVKISSPKGSCSFGGSLASVSAGSGGSSSSAVSRLFGGAAVCNAPAYLSGGVYSLI